MRTVFNALGWLKRKQRSRTREYDQKCKRLARRAFDIPSDGTELAREAALKTKHRLDVDPQDAPAGTFTWWLGGTSGHVVTNDGEGNGIANYWPDKGRIRTLPIATWNESMGEPAAFVSRDIDGVDATEASEPKPKPDPRPPAQKTYTVRTGDTLTEIAERFGLAVAELVHLNRIEDPNLIRVGQRLRLTKA